MPTAISSKSLTLADFQNFSKEQATSDTAIIGKKFFGSGAKQISSLNFQWAFGGTSEVVADFQKALAQKYGKEIADFVFSDDNRQAALSKGLNKETIAAVLNKAELISSSDFFSYRKAIQSKQETIKRSIKQLPEASRSSAKQAYLKSQDAWENCVNLFNAFSFDPSQSNPQTLKNYFDERLQFVDRLAREIIPESESATIAQAKSDTTAANATIAQAEIIFQEELGMSVTESRKSAASLRESLGDRLSMELIATAAQQRPSIHQLNEDIEKIVAVVDERTSSVLSGRRSSTDKQFLENLSLIPEVLKANSDRLSEQVQPFVNLLADAPPENYFYLSDDASQAVTLHSPHDTSSSAPTEEQQRAAARRFFSALKEFYGANLINSILPVEQQDQPLTVQQAREVLHSLCKAFESLKDNPIIITPEYLATLAHNQEAAAAARESHEQLGKEGQSLIRNLREMGICGMIFSGTKIGLAVAGVCTPTLPWIAIALVAAAVDGYVVGRLVTREEGLSASVQHEAGTVSAISTTGSATGLIASRILQPIIGAYVPEIVSSTAAEYGGSYVAIALQEAARGGANSATTDGVFLEPRIVRWFQLEPYLDKLFTAIGTVGGLMSAGSPSTGTPASSASLSGASTGDLTSS